MPPCTRPRRPRKAAKKTEAVQQEKETAEAETPEADLTETGQWERSEDKKSKKRIVRYQTLQDRLGNPAPPAAGDTSAAVADGAQRLSRLAGYTIPRVGALS